MSAFDPLRTLGLGGTLNALGGYSGGSRVMSKLHLLGLAEASVLCGLGIVYWLGYVDRHSAAIMFMVVIAAFFGPSLLAIRAEQRASRAAR